MDISQQILSDITIFNKYARYVPEIQRREDWEELCDRNMAMHIRKYPHMKEEIKAVYKRSVRPRKVLPSMRSIQFGGLPIELSNSRINNCAYTVVDDPAVFGETFFNLLMGSGVGYSVQHRHVNKLPVVIGPSSTNRKFLVSDDIEGWGNAVKQLFKAYYQGRPNPVFDLRGIRTKGAALVTSGGKAPGPEPLRVCLELIRSILNEAKGRKLKPIECHDILCHIADSVLTGGIRRAACISLFDADDMEMLTCKSGAWWELNPQRGRANNSVVLHRDHTTKQQWDYIWQRVEDSGSGEPGVFWTNNYDWGVNPCCFSGDMRLLTSSGYKSFEELSKLPSVTVINSNGEDSIGKVWFVGTKPVIGIRFEKLVEKDDIITTVDHRFMLVDGTECLAENLKSKQIMPYYYAAMYPVDLEAFMAGFILGDGSLGRLSSERHKGLEVHFGAKDGDIAKMYGQEVGTWYSREAMAIALKFGLADCKIGSRGLKTSNLCDDFISGLYSANGSVIRGHRVALKSIDRAQLQEVGEYLATKGIISYITTNKPTKVKFSNGEYLCKESYDLNISRFNSIVKFAEKFYFGQDYKRQHLKDLVIKRAPKVKSVVQLGEAPVYDFNEPITNWGVVEGVVAHNCEISLRPNSFCNLTTTDVSSIETQEQLNQAVKDAAFIGTLQAGYTDFHYLRPIWKETSEEDSLIGVSMTGIGSGAILKLNLTEAAEEVKNENVRVASLIGIKPAKRTNCIKPEGTASLVLGSSSGIHAWHNDYYIRRMRVGKSEALYNYMLDNFPSLIEDCKYKPHIEAVMSFPQKAPKGSILRTESAFDTLERVKKFSQEWVKPGHVEGDNMHNVSCTISVKDNEWESVGEWMWEQREVYTGISVLPYDGGTYVQAPFEDCTKEVYEQMMLMLKDVNLRDVVEAVDNTNLNDQAACGGGACTVV